MDNTKHYPTHPGAEHTPIMTCEIPLEEYESIKQENNVIRNKMSYYLDVNVRVVKENKQLKENQRWRKFPEEKPTEDIKFLVINEKGFMQCCYYSPILKEFQIPVTYWMPLPKAPEDM